jgi:hypothetical protein
VDAAPVAKLKERLQSAGDHGRKIGQLSAIQHALAYCTRHLHFYSSDAYGRQARLRLRFAVFFASANHPDNLSLQRIGPGVGGAWLVVVRGGTAARSRYAVGSHGGSSSHSVHMLYFKNVHGPAFHRYSNYE